LEILLLLAYFSGFPPVMETNLSDRTLLVQRIQNMVRQTVNVILYYESDVINNEH